MNQSTNILLANFRPRIYPNRVTHVKKALHGVGSFQVIMGQEVSPQDIIGKYQSPSGYFSINLANRLKTSANDANKYLQKKTGDRIYKGELLAQKKGFFGQSSLTSPTDGVIDYYDPKSGELKLKFFPQEISVTAGVFGIIDFIDKQTGEVYIKTIATEIHGILGLGKDRIGIIQTLNRPSGLLRPSQLTSNLNQRILISGALLDSDSFKKSVQLGVSGLIVGGINYSTFNQLVNKLDLKNNIVTDFGTTVLITEGFGPIPMSKDLFELLEKYEGTFAYIYGRPPKILLPSATSDSIITLRKCVVPSKINDNSLESKPIQVGAMVRIVCSNLAGITGKVIAIDQQPTIIASGISTFLLTIDTFSRKIKVPYNNIEIT